MTSPIFSSLRGAVSRRYRVAIWIARVLALAVTALYSFAWWEESSARQDPLLGGAVTTDVFYAWAIWTHLLPALALLVFTIVGWNRPGIGSVGFALFAFLQMFSVGSEWMYIPIVAAPGLIVAIAFVTAYRWGMIDQLRGRTV